MIALQQPSHQSTVIAMAFALHLPLCMVMRRIQFWFPVPPAQMLDAGAPLPAIKHDGSSDIDYGKYSIIRVYYSFDNLDFN